MADDPKPDLAKLLTEKVQHGRSSLQKWTWENYDQILKAMPVRRNWVVLAEAATEARMTDSEGKRPNPNSMRATFNRVKRIKDKIGAVPDTTRLNAPRPVPRPTAEPAPTETYSDPKAAARARLLAKMKPATVRKKEE
jgi:hypothetical protein